MPRSIPFTSPILVLFLLCFLAPIFHTSAQSNSQQTQSKASHQTFKKDPDADPFEQNNQDFMRQTNKAKTNTQNLDLFEKNNADFFNNEHNKPAESKTQKANPSEFDKQSANPPPPNPLNPEEEQESKKNRRESRLSDKPIGLQKDQVPSRPTPLLELGNPFLGTGPINLGFELPTGSVWQPTLLIYGTLRSAVNTFERSRATRASRETVTEWVNRLDIFANLQLAGFANERLVFGMRPLDRGLYDEPFSGYVFDPRTEDGEVNEFNDRITALFFEGDFGEVFPFLDRKDSASLDLGFSIGRQFLSIQNGVLINDLIDAVGFTRNNLRVPFAANWRLTTLFVWNHLDRGNNFRRDDDARLFALLSSTDLNFATIDVDLTYTLAPRDTRDAVHMAISSTQRVFGSIATTLRAAVSLPIEGQTAANTRGGLIVLESSWTPTGRDDVLFVNAYWGLDQYQSAARAPSSGGPLANIGILYAAPGLGRYPSPLEENPARSAGASVGYQCFLGSPARQLIVEVGARQDTSHQNQGMLAAGLRVQQAFWQRFLLQADAFLAKQERRPERIGARIELQIQF